MSFTLTKLIIKYTSRVDISNLLVKLLSLQLDIRQINDSSKKNTPKLLI